MKGFLSRKIRVVYTDGRVEKHVLSVIFPQDIITTSSVNNNNVGKKTIKMSSFLIYPFVSEVAGVEYIDSEIVIRETESGEFVMFI